MTTLFKASMVVNVFEWFGQKEIVLYRSIQDIAVFVGNHRAQCLWNSGRGSGTEIIVELVFRSEQQKDLSDKRPSSKPYEIILQVNNQSDTYISYLVCPEFQIYSWKSVFFLLFLPRELYVKKWRFDRYQHLDNWHKLSWRTPWGPSSSNYSRPDRQETGKHSTCVSVDYKSRNNDV